MIINIGVLNRASGYGGLMVAYYEGLEPMNRDKMLWISSSTGEEFQGKKNIVSLLDKVFWDVSKWGTRVTSLLGKADAIVVFWDIDKANEIASFLKKHFIFVPVISVSTPDEMSSVALNNENVHGCILPCKEIENEVSRYIDNTIVVPFFVKHYPFIPYIRNRERSLLKLQDSDRLWLYIGRWQYRKNVGQILSMIKLITSVFKDYVFLHIDSNQNDMGNSFFDFGDFFSKDEIERIIFDYNYINSGVSSEEQMLNIYNMADVVFSVSYYEGLGLPLLEGLLSGLFVVSPAFITTKSYVRNLGLCNRVYWLEKSDYNVIYNGGRFVESLYNLDLLREYYIENNNFFKRTYTSRKNIDKKQWANSILYSLEKLLSKPRWRKI